MFFISHRANTNGPNPNKENHPDYIKETMSKCFDVEVDVWLEKDGFYLGHDKPQYKIDRYFLQNKKIWTHCKNIEAYIELFKYTDINCFYQTEEDIVATSRGYLWAHSKCKFYNNKTIITCLNATDEVFFEKRDAFGVCSDYVSSDYIYSNSCIKNELPFDLLILDIDGVLTTGNKIYDRDGKVLAKTYCDLDFTAIKRFKAAGIQICFLSGDKTINEKMAETRQVKFFHNAPGTNKVDILPEIISEFKPKKIAYIGDDYYDLSIMNAVDMPFCPKNSPKVVRNNCTVLDVHSGEGVVAELYNLFEEQIYFAYPMDSADVNPK